MKQYALSLQQLRCSKQAVLELFPALEAGSAGCNLSEKLANISLSPAPTPRRPSSTLRTSSTASSSSSVLKVQWAESLHLLQYPLTAEAEPPIPQEAYSHAISAVHHALTALLPEFGNQASSSRADLLSALKQDDSLLSLVGIYKTFELSTADQKKVDSVLAATFSAINRLPAMTSSATAIDLEIEFGVKCFGLRCLLESHTFLLTASSTQRPEETIVGNLHKTTLAYCKGLVATGDSMFQMTI